MCEYLYVYVHVHVHVHVYVYAYVYVCMRMRMRVCGYVYAYVYAYSRMAHTQGHFLSCFTSSKPLWLELVWQLCRLLRNGSSVGV